MIPKLMRSGVLLSAALAIVSLLPSVPSQSAPGLTESELKAVFLLRLPQFVSWPDDQSGTIFCIAPATELSSLLQEIVALEPKGREVRPLLPGQINNCDIVFGSRSDTVEDLAAVRGVLWVSDQPGFARDGGMVELKRNGERMRMLINLRVLESAGLRASSKLLQLSEVVGYLPDDA